MYCLLNSTSSLNVSDITVSARLRVLLAMCCECVARVLIIFVVQNFWHDVVLHAVKDAFFVAEKMPESFVEIFDDIRQPVHHRFGARAAFFRREWIYDAIFVFLRYFHRLFFFRRHRRPHLPIPKCRAQIFIGYGGQFSREQMQKDG